jgi:hypothetical protein
VRFLFVVVVLVLLLALATVVPALVADRMQPTSFRTYVGPFEQPGTSRVVELDLGRNPGEPLVVPDIPGAPPVPVPEQRLYLILLGVLVLLLTLPACLRHLSRAAGVT